jgi:protein-arginine kinase activator protein McsA
VSDADTTRSDPEQTVERGDICEKCAGTAYQRIEDDVRIFCAHCVGTGKQSVALARMLRGEKFGPEEAVRIANARARYWTM